MDDNNSVGTDKNKEGGSNYFYMRIDSNLKENFAKFCKKKGISISKAISLFVIRFVRDGSIPYKLGQADFENGTNSVQVGYWMDISLRRSFSDICRNKYDMPMSFFVRDFMNECVSSGAFPYDIRETLENL